MAKSKKEKTKEETAIAVIAPIVAENKHEKFRADHEEKFFMIKDVELAELIINNLEEDLTKKQLVRLLDWDRARVEVIMNCSKASAGKILKLGEEKDFILYLISKDILPEGHYIVLVT